MTLHVLFTDPAGNILARGKLESSESARYGQLAGVLYGEGRIDASWRERLARRGTILALADALVALADTLGVPEPGRAH